MHTVIVGFEIPEQAEGVASKLTEELYQVVRTTPTTA